MRELPDIPTTGGLLNRLGNSSDQEARGDFVARYSGFILAICFRYLEDEHEANDASQFILLRFLERHRFKSFRYEPSKRFRSWLQVVVKNDVRSYLRHRRRMKPALFLSAAQSARVLANLEDESVTEAMALEMETLFEQERCLGEKALALVAGRVEPHTMQAFLLTALEGRSGAEVAAKLNMTPAAVYRARHRVAKLLEEEYKLMAKGPEETF